MSLVSACRVSPLMASTCALLKPRLHRPAPMRISGWVSCPAKSSHLSPLGDPSDSQWPTWKHVIINTGASSENGLSTSHTQGKEKRYRYPPSGRTAVNQTHRNS